MESNKYMCPCCNSSEFSDKYSYEICNICGWQNDPVQNKDPDFSGGANERSLNECKFIQNHNIKPKISYQNGKIDVLISPNPDWKLFEVIFEKIQKAFEITLISKLDGIDERYWDFKTNNGLITLHLQHFLGISLFPSEDASLNKEVIKIAEMFFIIDPS